VLCVGSPDGTWELRDLRSGLVHPIEPRAARASSMLLRGLDGEDAADAAAALGETWTDERDEPFDRIVRERLARLGAGFAWTTAPRDRWLVDLCEAAHSMLRQSKGELDQLPVLPETAARRASLLRAKAGAGARVALVGDDDLLAVPAAALGLRPTALDIDPDLLALHEVIAAKLELDVTTRQVDLREPVPADLRGAFDAFCTDPESTRECVCLFLSRGVSLVRAGGLGLVAGGEDWADVIAAAARDIGLAGMTRMRRFGNYRSVGFELSPYRSDQYTFEVPAAARPLVGPDESFREDLFSFATTGGDHLLIVARGCEPARARGRELVDLVVELCGARLPTARVEDRSPFPVRVVSCTGELGSIQVTVRADTSTVDVDISPAPDDEVRVRGIAQRVADVLSAHGLQMRSLAKIG